MYMSKLCCLVQAVLGRPQDVDIDGLLRTLAAQHVASQSEAEEQTPEQQQAATEAYTMSRSTNPSLQYEPALICKHFLHT